jgi:hypothetical protein
MSLAQMAQYTSGGCYNLGNVNPAPTFTYHQNPGDGSYMDIKFTGGDDGRSAEITYYCNRQGEGVQSFQYDYESPIKNFVRPLNKTSLSHHDHQLQHANIKGPQVCQPLSSTTAAPRTTLAPSPCQSAQPGGLMPLIAQQFSASYTYDNTDGTHLLGTMYVDLQVWTRFCGFTGFSCFEHSTHCAAESGAGRVL